MTDEPGPSTNASRFASPGSGWSDAASRLDRAAASVVGMHHGMPLPSGEPSEVLAAVSAALGKNHLPENGVGEAAALGQMAQLIARYGLDLTNSLTAAHLQPPPLTVAVAADALASATNASLDTYDSGPATLAIEAWTISTLAHIAGFGDSAGGVFGPGGSYSNLLGLMLARDYSAASRGLDSRQHGVANLRRPTVFCSAAAHFSIQRACATLGLGEGAVVPVAVDDSHRMIPAALESSLDASDGTPIAIVATAGTTDFGTIDPLAEVAGIASDREVWLHVDAAYGFGTLFSDRLSHLIAGLHLADSVTLDLHKIGWQPAAASVLLLADVSRFGPLERNVAYLNPEDDEEAGFGGQLGRTLQTTRRPDAIKVAATFLAYGRGGLGDMLNACHDLARYAERRIATELQLELVAPVTITTVVFRYRCEDIEGVNAELRRRLIRDGRALVGRTSTPVRGSDPCTCLKLTLLNPETTESEIDALFDDLLRMALEVESEATEGISKLLGVPDVR